MILGTRTCFPVLKSNYPIHCLNIPLEMVCHCFFCTMHSRLAANILIIIPLPPPRPPTLSIPQPSHQPPLTERHGIGWTKGRKRLSTRLTISMLTTSDCPRSTRPPYFSGCFPVASMVQCKRASYIFFIKKKLFGSLKPHYVVSFTRWNSTRFRVRLLIFCFCVAVI